MQKAERASARQQAANRAESQHKVGEGVALWWSGLEAGQAARPKTALHAVLLTPSVGKRLRGGPFNCQWGRHGAAGSPECACQRSNAAQRAQRRAPYGTGE